ncbi:hypothetical protein Dda_2055 [Drechslerella dactyloides]|uniref:SHSP domain-containing protein n=1 Tax=Drechslerella dactyloides TaxID=74499 RepID=A0AAD6J703_DREDA|nr:hypothetical protein Dda_2055 [Drechslerella dactyloides]
MPFVRFAPLSDPFVDLLSAALAEATTTPPTKHAAQESSCACGGKCTGACAGKSCGPAQCAARSCPPRQNRVVKRVISPRFDVSETEGSYILEGELPGVTAKSAAVSIDFDDAQTLVIRGEVTRAKRAFHKIAPTTTTTDTDSTATAESTAVSTEKEKEAVVGEETVVYDDAASDSSRKLHATVEDDVDESETASNASFEVVEGPTRAEKGKAPATTDVEMTDSTTPAEKPAAPITKEKKERTKVPLAKYWIAERAVGVFERRFKFQGLVDTEKVKATLENGLLTVIVPKREPVIRSIFIQ